MTDESVWTGAVNFVLVAIPVEIAPAIHEDRLAFRLMHDREHMVALWAQGDALVLMLLHYREQIADREAIRPQQVRPPPAKVGAITAVIQGLRGEYNPAHYLDEQRQRVLGLLQEKARQQGTVAAHKTMACVYSLRARSRPTVSTPVHWREVEQALARRDAGMLVYMADEAVVRLEKEGDLFEPVLTLKQELPGSVPHTKTRRRPSPAGSARQPLATYRAKRDFSVTPEPADAEE
jgi:hypothetical protein